MMRFTQAIADYILKKHPRDLQDVLVVFPGRRAGLFFLHELSAQHPEPMMAPRITTLDQLTAEMTGLRQEDSLPLLFDLYKIYTAVTGQTKSFDDFLFQGQTLLSDFNECDNELIDIEKLFVNISDLKTIDRDYSDNVIYAKEFILGFWQMFIGNRHFELQAEFGRLWEKLPEVYRQFAAVCGQKGCGYGGAIMRKAATDKECIRSFLTQQSLSAVYFAGFNALTRAEKKVFGQFKQSGIAGFLWDFDDYYVKDPNQEAGMFMRENLILFPMPSDFRSMYPELFCQYSTPKKISVIPLPQVTDQARYLETLASGQLNHPETAIVLADEKLLIPVIHALPPTLPVNVTMGYEIRNTATFALLDSVLNLYRNSRNSKRGTIFRAADVSRVVMHPFFRNHEKGLRILQRDLLTNRSYIPGAETAIPEKLRYLFSFSGRPGDFILFITELLRSVHAEVNALSEYPAKETELQAVFEMHSQLHQLHRMMSEGDASLEQITTASSLIRRAVSLLTLSFRGEPLSGLQVMGLLETRALDFRQLIILSANEGILPKSSATTSFIPMTLRQGFRMRTPSYDEAIFAYNFYRLIQRTENVVITWCSGQGITEKPEMSRYLLQLLHEKVHIPEIVHMGIRPRVNARPGIVVEKSPEIMERLNGFTKGERRLSASAINAYIDCSLRFYFNYIAGLKESDEPMDEDMDNRIIGSLFHKTAEVLYDSLFRKGQTITAGDFSSITEKDYDSALQTAFKDVLHYNHHNYHDYLSGTEWLYDEIIRRYIKALIAWESKNTPFVYMGHENEVETEFENTGIRIYGRLDRMDEKDSSLVVTDYKASELRDMKVKTELAFSSSVSKRSYIFQIYFYRYLIAKKFNRPVNTRLLAVNRLITGENCIVSDESENAEVSAEQFTEGLREILNSLFSKDIPFSQPEDINACRFCHYKAICNREAINEF